MTTGRPATSAWPTGWKRRRNLTIFAVGIDNNSDGDIDDAGDDVEIDDDFSSTTMSLTYDNNGNLTDDGLFKFAYDAWNRLVEVTRRVDDETTVAAYEYDGRNRRTMKTVSNCGVEDTPNDGGNTTVHYYYSGGAGVSPANWNICETRNGSSQTTFQYVWGTQYVDELVLIDKNGDPTESNDCDPDDQSGESTADERYFVHQDRNWNVVALTDYDPSGSDEGNVVERYHYTPYGQFIVLKGDAGNGEMGNALPTSTVGNVFCFQGLYHDQETGTDQQRWRQRHRDRFLQRDPLGYTDGPDLYAYVGGSPNTLVDPLGATKVYEGDPCSPVYDPNDPSDYVMGFQRTCCCKIRIFGKCIWWGFRCNWCPMVCRESPWGDNRYFLDTRSTSPACTGWTGCQFLVLKSTNHRPLRGRQPLAIGSSIALSVTVCAWLLSYWHISVDLGEGHYHLFLWQGVLEIAHSEESADSSQIPGSNAFSGFRAYALRWLPAHVQTSRGQSVHLPLWLLAFVFSLIPAMHLLTLRRAYRRFRLQLCVVCGYDLRHSGCKCPECGSEVLPRGCRFPRPRSGRLCAAALGCLVLLSTVVALFRLME